MNIASVMSIRTSGTRSQADVTASVDEEKREVTLNFSQLPAIKIEALHRLMVHSPEQPSMDLARELKVFAEHIWLVFGLDNRRAAYTAWTPDFSYEIVIKLNDGAGSLLLVNDLRRYLRREAGIVLRFAQT